jgi:hypothetical protein
MIPPLLRIQNLEVLLQLLLRQLLPPIQRLPWPLLQP